MNTKTETNNKGIRFAISKFKLETGFYLTPDIRRMWTVARDEIAAVEGINTVVEKGSRFHQIAVESLPGYLFTFENITMMHKYDVYDALCLAATRSHKRWARRFAKRAI
jgi:hypothetical protein